MKTGLLLNDFFCSKYDKHRLACTRESILKIKVNFIKTSTKSYYVFYWLNSNMSEMPIYKIYQKPNHSGCIENSF